jgi:hypothetical protein
MGIEVDGVAAGSTADVGVLRVTPAQALLDGIRRVNKAPVILACACVITLLTALPFSMVLREALRAHLGNSLAADEAVRGVNYQWWTEFTAQSSGFAQSFTVTIIGFAAVLDNLSTFLERGSRPAALLWLGAGYLLLWLFLTGGILDRYARNRQTRSHEFFTACGVYFVRFLRLAPIIAFTYYVLFRYVHTWLFDDLYDELTRNLTVERTAFMWRVALYAAFGLLLLTANVIFDYAKVRAVVEDRRSMIGAIVAGVRFVRRNLAGVVALYLLDGLMFVAVVAIYALVAPGAGTGGPVMWLGFAVSQAYLLARLWVRLLFLGSETSLFQGRLAHAGYVANAAPPRPEPPVVEQVLGPKS